MQLLKKTTLPVILVATFLLLIFFVFKWFSLPVQDDDGVPVDTLYLDYFSDPADTAKAHMLYKPETVRVDSFGNVYVLDKGNHRIVQYNSQGEFIKQIGSIGQGPGELLGPVDFCLDQSGLLYVLEENNKRISIFDASGRFLKTFNFQKVEGVGSPRRICVNSKGEILVVYPVVGEGLIHFYDRTGNKIDAIGEVDEFHIIHDKYSTLIRSQPNKHSSMLKCGRRHPCASPGEFV